MTESKRKTAIGIIVVLLAIWLGVLIKDLHVPRQLPKADQAMQIYVEENLRVRKSIGLNGLEILRWADGEAEGLYKLLDNNYTPLIEGNDVVDGTHCLSVRFKPKLKLRPWIQLWIEPNTGKICAAREWTAENRRKTLGVEINVSASALPKYSDLPTDSLAPAEFPEGYRYLYNISHPGDVIQYFYTDGFQVISLVVGAKNAVNAGRLSVTEMGFVRIASRQTDNYMIMLVGDLPADVAGEWLQMVEPR